MYEDEVVEEDPFHNEPNALTAGIGTSVVRTVVPLIVGLIITYATKAGFDISEAVVQDAVYAGVVTLYYVLVRLAETHLSPKWGWLLGQAKVPTYSPLGPSNSYDPEG